ncbi:DNA binding / DNA-directed RNA polymerase [Wolffia australiana]
MPRRPAAAKGPSPPQGPAGGAQDQRLSNLSETERKAFDAIWRKGDMGMWTADLKAELGLAGNMPAKIINALKGKGLIKDVVNYRNRGRKMVMAAEFEPNKEISGGSWYVDGDLDVEFIAVLRPLCRRAVERAPGGVATLEAIAGAIRDSRAFKVDCSLQQIGDIMGALVLDGEVLELTSTGRGDFAGVPPGKRCYRCPRAGGAAATMGALASIPCGVCPRIAECTPDGVISPKTCVYYDKWLGSLQF